jgi:hypothetical protein
LAKLGLCSTFLKSPICASSALATPSPTIFRNYRSVNPSITMTALGQKQTLQAKQDFNGEQTGGDSLLCDRRHSS